jgi:hypothetical protein
LSRKDVCLPNIEGLDFGVFPSNGSLLYTKELIESKDELEFIGTGAVTFALETVVTHMSIARFNMNLPPQEFN